jgi:hypothetical protein
MRTRDDPRLVSRGAPTQMIFEENGLVITAIGSPLQNGPGRGRGGPDEEQAEQDGEEDAHQLRPPMRTRPSACTTAVDDPRLVSRGAPTQMIFEENGLVITAIGSPLQRATRPTIAIGASITAARARKFAG